MALTQISTAGVKDDAVTSGKIPANAVGSSEIAANAVGSSELADNAVDTAAIADQAVTLDKLPHGTSSNNGKFLRANNGADPTFETVTSTTINNNANNRVITGSGTADTLEAEPNLTWDATTFKVQAGAPALEISGTNSNGGNSSLHFNANANHWVLEADNYTQQNVFSIKSGTTSSSTPRLSINSAGNVGIKTSSPIGTLDIYDGNLVLSKPNASGNERNWRFLNNNVAAGNLGLQCSTTAGGSSFSNVIEIKSNGRVGIGDTNPQSKLAVSDGGSTADPVIMAHVANSNGGFLGFGLYSTINSAYTFKVTNNGRVHAKDGIIFGTDTAATNVLDDYEEGTYTPTVRPSANASAWTYSTHYELRSPHASGATNAVAYTKIGNRVYLSFSIYFNTSGTSRVSFSLPFAIKNNDYQCAGHCGYFTVAGAYGVTFIGQGLSKIDIMENDSNGGHPDLSYATNTEVYFNFHYETN